MSTQPIEGTHINDEVISHLVDIKFMIQEMKDKKEQKISDDYLERRVRKDVIEMATEDMNYLLANDSREVVGEDTTEIISYDANIDWFEFEVNHRERKVIAKQMVKHYHDNSPTELHRGIAVCPENEKFNPAIGSVVALYKSLGKRVPDTFKNVPFN